jgi:hypothetical protein
MEIRRMAAITDEYMKQMLSTTKDYCVCILRATPKRKEPGVESVVREHGRRNFSLRADGRLAIVCMVDDGSDVRGISIFNASLNEVKKIMDEDPAVMDGVFTYELHPSRSFPGDSLTK